MKAWVAWWRKRRKDSLLLEKAKAEARIAFLERTNERLEYPTYGFLIDLRTSYEKLGGLKEKLRQLEEL